MPSRPMQTTAKGLQHSAKQPSLPAKPQTAAKGLRKSQAAKQLSDDAVLISMYDNPFLQRLTAKEIRSLENAGMIGDNVITFFLGMLVLEQMKKADADREWVILTTFFFAKLYE